MSGTRFAPGHQSRRIIIIGAGAGGICMGVALKQAGIENFLILEKADKVGGTWAHNVYPGSACDAKSRMYSFSFDLNPHWTRPRCKQPEIQNYFERCVDKFGLRSHLRLRTAVRQMHWDDECTTWRVVTDSNEVLTADIVVSSMGLFNEPNWPKIDGIESFNGRAQHAARWDPDTNLAGKNVAVIGSGASAIQIVPSIAPIVKNLHVFQRTAPWVLPKPDDPYPDGEIEEIQRNPIKERLMRLEIFNEYERFVDFTDQEMLADMETQARANLLAVTDSDKRLKLTPKYPYGFSRPLFSSEYLPTFNRSNVELVTDPIVKITDRGVLTVDGKERVVDDIIFATGFQTTKWLSALEVTGRAGVPISTAWKDGAIAYLGITTSGFPNLFMTYGPNTNNGSIIFMIECQVAYIARHILHMFTEGIAWVDIRRDAMDSYNRDLQRAIDKVAVWQTDANGYYRGESGQIVTQYPHIMAVYRAETMKPDSHNYEMQHGTSLALYAAKRAEERA